MKKERFTKASRPFFFARLSQIFLQRCFHRAGGGGKLLKVSLHQIGKADFEEVHAPDALQSERRASRKDRSCGMSPRRQEAQRTQGGKQRIGLGSKAVAVVIHSHQITQPACEYQRDHFQGRKRSGKDSCRKP